MKNMETKDLRCIRWPLSNPDSGMLKATQVSWHDVEPAEGQFDFTMVQMANPFWKRTRKRLSMRLLWIPMWLLFCLWTGFVIYLRKLRRPKGIFWKDRVTERYAANQRGGHHGEKQ